MAKKKVSFWSEGKKVVFMAYRGAKRAYHGAQAHQRATYQSYRPPGQQARSVSANIPRKPTTYRGYQGRYVRVSNGDVYFSSNNNGPIFRTTVGRRKKKRAR